MAEIVTLVGKRLKSFRKMRGLSVDQLANRIGRSNATVYKYESGEIDMDLNTLGQVAAALNLEPALFFDIPNFNSAIKQHIKAPIAFFDSGHFYTYYYDGRVKRIVRSLLAFHPTHEETGYVASFYMNLKDFNQPESSRYIYRGTLTSHETVSFFIMENITLPIEIMTIEVIHPFQASQTTWGVFLGLSDQPLAPMTTKMLFSKMPLSNKELEAYPLALTKNELKGIRLNNALLLSIREEES